jgi:hypothetical protein
MLAFRAQLPELTPGQLRAVEAETLDAPRLGYSILALALFKVMDLAYGRSRTIVKFTPLEFIARVPYQAWERAGYLALAHHRWCSALARRGLRQSLIMHRLAPWLIAFCYYHVPWLLFLIRPAWSYRLNADFEAPCCRNRCPAGDPANRGEEVPVRAARAGESYPPASRTPQSLPDPGIRVDRSAPPGVTSA